ncbi:hypothetical protein [Nakamurella sp.]|uniref:hypothetical protein n=1 Tax=Nakamurella sp. TaxID=1869182 RepID=UPI003784CB71
MSNEARTRHRRVRRALVGVGTVLALTAVSVATAAPAQAAVSELANYPGYGVVVACKTLEYGGYGPVWRIQLVAASNVGKVVSGKVVVTRAGAYIGETSTSGRNGRWGVSYVYASAYFSDSYRATTGFGELDGRGAGGTSDLRPVTAIANC